MFLVFYIYFLNGSHICLYYISAAIKLISIVETKNMQIDVAREWQSVFSFGAIFDLCGEDFWSKPD